MRIERQRDRRGAEIADRGQGAADLCPRHPEFPMRHGREFVENLDAHDAAVRHERLRLGCTFVLLADDVNEDVRVEERSIAHWLLRG